MSSNLAVLPEPEPLRAITVSRDVQDFELLIEDMEAELGEAWGDLSFAEAGAFLKQDDADALQFIVIAVDKEDEDRLPQVTDLITDAKTSGTKIILVADGLGPTAIHELLRSGADEFVPYPLPENALADAIVSLASKPAQTNPELAPAPTGDPSQSSDNLPAAMGRGQNLPTVRTGGGDTRDGAIFAFQSASGGDGATTLAVNLAWELANASKNDAPTVCVIDLGLQFGSVATYFDLPRKQMIYEVLSDVDSMDEQAFRQALGTYKDKVSVFTAPSDILPLDLIGPDDVSALLNLARTCFDIVIVDMPMTITAWTETVFSLADIYFLVCGMEVRSAQNTMRFHKLLQSEGIAIERLKFVLNRGPGKMDMSGKGRVEKMAESLGVKFHTVLPDGGKQVTEINDLAAPLSVVASRNPLAKEIQKLAMDLFEARQAIQVGADPAGMRKQGKKAIFGLKFG